MAISRVVTVRVLPKRLNDFITRLGQVKKILERHGARVTFFRTLAGSDPNGVLVVSTVDDWPQFAQVAAKVEADGEWQAFERQLVDDPVAERVSSSMIQDFTLP